MLLREILSKNEQDKIVLPDFQRDFVWKVEAQKRLLASFFVNLPVGSILLLEGTLDEFQSRKMCFPNENINPGTPSVECAFLLDGQQRISVLKSCFSDIFKANDDWKLSWESTYPNLRNRWFLRVIPNDNEEDVLGYYNLQFNNPKTKEPNEIKDFIEFKKVNKTKIGEWYHPGFRPKNASGAVLEAGQRRSKIIGFAALEGLVPLHELFEVKPTLHKSVLQRISTNRMNELKDETINDRERLCEVLSTTTYADEIHEGDPEVINQAFYQLASTWATEVAQYLESLLDIKIPANILPSTEIHRAVATFESMNEGGTALSVFDLMVAKAARNSEKESLSKQLISKLNSPLSFPDALVCDVKGTKPNEWTPNLMKTVKDNSISAKVQNQYLNMLSIIVHGCPDPLNLKVEHIKKQTHLRLTNQMIHDNSDLAAKSLIRALAFLQLRCGIVTINDIPYELMILPIAYVLKEEKNWTSKAVLSKIEAWYWSALFGGAYYRGQNVRCIDDIIALYRWLNGEPNPFKPIIDNVLNFDNYSDKKLLIRERSEDIPSAIKSGLLQYVLSGQPKDFWPNQTIYLNPWDIAAEKECNFTINNQQKTEILKIEAHHLCPLGSETKLGQTSKELRNDKNHKLNSPLNLTFISSAANKIINDKSPSTYLQYVSHITQWNHFVPSCLNATTKLDNTFYSQFLEARYNELTKAIKQEIDNLISIQD